MLDTFYPDLSENIPDVVREKLQSYISLYGNVKIPKGYCQNCKSFSFVLNGKLACCDEPYEQQATEYKRETLPEQKRRNLTTKEKIAQLEAQNYKCFYCERTFDSVVFRRSKPIKLRVCFDHFVPYSLTQDNRAKNYVASCQVCNGIKTSHFFNTTDDAKVYINNRRIEKGYED